MYPLGPEEIERGLVRRVERRVPPETFRQIRVRQKRNAKGHRVGLARRQHLVAGLERESFVRNVASAKRRLQLRPDPTITQLFAGADKGDAALAHFASHITKRGQRVGIAHVVRVAPRCQVQSDAVRAPHGNRCVHHLQHQPGAVFHRSRHRRPCDDWSCPGETDPAGSRWPRESPRRQTRRVCALSAPLR